MNTPTIPSFLSALALLTLPAGAATYTDATGDFTGGFAGLDITSANVNNDATTLTFTVNLAGDPTTYDWHNYIVGIAKASLPGVGGNANAGGGWSKDIQMSAGGMDYFIGAYPFYSGYDLKTWDGVSAWNGTGGSASWNSSSATFSVALASLGLSAGDSFKFDLWTTSNGNTVLDALSDVTSRGFNNNPFDTGANGLSYTVAAVPEPTVGALAGISALILVRRTFRRRTTGR